jgi:hypothetical protein
MDEGHDDKQADGSHVEGCDRGSDPEIVDSTMASIKMTKGYQTVSKQRALSQRRIFFGGARSCWSTSSPWEKAFGACLPESLLITRQRLGLMAAGRQRKGWHRACA